MKSEGFLFFALGLIMSFDFPESVTSPQKPNIGQSVDATRCLLDDHPFVGGEPLSSE